MQITEHFNSKKDKMECSCCGALVYDEHMINRLEILRQLIDVPFRVNSFYRCAFHNKAVGGSERSRHMHGDAVDINTRGWNGALKWEFTFEAMKLGFSVISYSDFIHIDLRPGAPIFLSF